MQKETGFCEKATSGDLHVCRLEKGYMQPIYMYTYMYMLHNLHGWLYQQFQAYTEFRPLPLAAVEIIPK